VQLPHIISNAGVTYELSPEADVPDEYGAAMIRTHPKLFVEGKGPVDLKLYTFKDSFKNKTVTDIVAGLDDEGKLKAYNAVKAIAEGKDAEAIPQSTPPSGLSEDEQTLVFAFRAMDDEDKDLTLNYVKRKV
jgi:hypothetical protein